VNHGTVSRDVERTPPNEPSRLRHDRAGLTRSSLMVQTGYGERPGQRPRYLDLHQPLGTTVNGQKHALVAAFLWRNTSAGSSAMN
jgi:hypothetical protein